MPPVNLALIGAGGFSRWHITSVLKNPRRARIVAVAEPSEASRERVSGFFAEAGKQPPLFYDDYRELLKADLGLDGACVLTPHKFHFEHARAVLKAGLHVFVEKPMVLNADEARKLIRVRDQAKRHLAIGFPSSYSGARDKALKLLAGGFIGEVKAIQAFAQQDWARLTVGTWRQNPELSGGGFLFDTGSHMINTLVDLAGSPIAEVSALLDNDGTPVEINSVVSGRFSNGILFSMTGAGNAVNCQSDIFIFGTKGVLRTGIWGERLEHRKQGQPDFLPLPHRRQRNTVLCFIDLVSGKLTDNPCPAETGLRFAQMMDLIRQSADTGQRATA
ncbi:MAG: Gfo/Idh/MocA family protein [Opitutales bacterium]